jgi:hypothetical protein
MIDKIVIKTYFYDNDKLVTKHGGACVNEYPAIIGLLQKCKESIMETTE